MSGGHFDYNQHRVREIAEDIDRLVARHYEDEWSEAYNYGFRPEIIERFKEASHTLNQAADMAQRVDWLVSGDDGQDSFMRRWDKEVRDYFENVTENATDDGQMQLDLK